MSGSSCLIKSVPTTTNFNNTDNNIRKITVGEVDPAQPLKDGKVLMLVGATGSGKSTLINGFVNYMMGVKYSDKYRYTLITDKQWQEHSQTRAITSYKFPRTEGNYRKQPFTFTIIDTPGYGDTGGLNKDKEITKQIKEFFSLKGKEGIDHLDGIGFVVQSSLPRLTPTQKYIFDSILSIFGKDIGKNIFIMATFADGKKPQILDAIKEQGIEYQQVFKFNNSALFPDKGADNDDDDSFNEMCWNMGEKSFQTFCKKFAKVKYVSLQLTREVLRERDQLECLIQGLQQQIQAWLTRVDQLHEEERIMKLHIETNKDFTNSDFTFEIIETRQQKVDGRFESVYDLRLTKTSASAVQAELKRRYEEAKRKKTQNEEMIGLKNELDSMYQVVFLHISNARESIARLEEIALRPNPLSEVQYIDQLIQTEKMEAKEGFTGRVKALKEVRKQAEVLKKIKDEKSGSLMGSYKAGISQLWNSIQS